MRGPLIRVAIAACTFIIGIAATILWLRKPSHRTISDPTVYTVSFCGLARNPTLYDGKIVRTQTVYSMYAEASHLYDYTCKAWMRPGCAATTKQCDEIWNRILEAMRSGLPKVKIDAVGRYTASADSGGAQTPLFEILELKSVEPTDEPDR
jgi:hypothetical protein